MNYDRRPGGSRRVPLHGNRCEGAPLAELQDALAADLDLERVGALLLTVVAASELARHSDARSTAQDYLHPEQAGDLEGQYVKDVLCASTPDVVERWFGGSALRYLQLAREAVAEHVASKEAV